MGSARWVVQIVNGFAVDKVAPRTRWLELACSAKLRRENDFLTGHAGSVRSLVVMARVAARGGKSDSKDEDERCPEDNHLGGVRRKEISTPGV